jgi:hypothetical protein
MDEMKKSYLMFKVFIYQFVDAPPPYLALPPLLTGLPAAYLACSLL